MKKILFFLLALGLLIFLFWKELFLSFVVITGKSDVSENKEIIWEKGPENRTDDRPNFIVFVADDLGINDLTSFGSGIANGKLPTPNIDFIANTGIKFSNAYAGTGMCAPSRAMIVTGRYATSTGYEFTPLPDGMGRSLQLFAPFQSVEVNTEALRSNPKFELQGLPNEEITFADQLSMAGYHTTHIGKWHLGRGEGEHPNAQGFKESLLMASGLFLPVNDPNVVNAYLDHDPVDKFLWARMQYAASFNQVKIGENWFEPKGYLTDYYTNEARKVIRANKNRPFLLYLGHWGVHTPLQALKSDYDELSNIEDHTERVYAAMIKALDRSIEGILDELNIQGLADNTWIIFTSDNGGAGYLGLRYINAPYRGWKLSLFEGGIKVPLIFWKEGISEKEVFERAAHIDIAPTIYALAKETPKHSVDGIDLFSNSSEAKDRALFWRTGHNKVVIKDGWKLQLSDHPKREWLFNLNNDPTEKVDLSKENLTKVAELKTILNEHLKNSKEPLFQSSLKAKISIDRTLKEVVEDGWEEDEDYVMWPN